MNKRYGLPYMGSKSKHADWLNKDGYDGLYAEECSSAVFSKER